MSRLDPLVDVLKKTDADEVRLVVGERIYFTNGGKRTDIGREPLQQGTLTALAAEVFDAKAIASLRDGIRSARIERMGLLIEVTAQVLAGVLTLVIKRAPAAQAAQATTVAAPKRERLIDEILDEMMSKKASDLHLSSNCHPALRVHGEMHFLKERPVLSSDAILGLLGPIFSEKARKDFEEKHDADFAYEVPGLARFRVNVFVDRMGVGAVMRQIPIEIIPADKLGLPQA